MKSFYWFVIFVIAQIMFWKSKEPENSNTPNYDFYMNKKKSEPYGDYIDNIHKNWWNDYDKLEKHHG